jgi:hypothetical protein
MVRREPRSEQNSQSPHNWRVSGRFSFHATVLVPEYQEHLNCPCGRQPEIVMYNGAPEGGATWALRCYRCAQDDELKFKWATHFLHVSDMEQPLQLGWRPYNEPRWGFRP